MRFEPWWEDLRVAARALARAGAFSSAAVLTLAAGIAGTTTLFALVNGVLLRPLPVPEQDRLIVGWKEFPSGTFAHWPFRATEVEAIGRESRLLERVSGASYYGAGSGGVVFEGGRASYLRAASVMGGFFDVVGVAPVLGRALRPADDVAGAENALVISHGLWRGRYGGSRDALGRRLVIGSQPFTIVGVMPPDFDYPRGAEAWTTLRADASVETNPAFREGILRDVDLVARLRAGVTLEQARSELQAFVTALEAGLPPDSARGLRPVVRAYEDVVVGDVRPALLLLFGAVGLVLLIASANVANLLLLRGESRRQELALRAALGAGPGRLARQLLAESVLLSLAAGVVGLAVSRWLLQIVLALVPGGLPRVESVRVGPVVFLFTLGLALLTAGLAGVAPALATARADLASELRAFRQAGGGAVARKGRRALVVVQVALAVAVVAAAGLLTRSLVHLQSVDMGLAADRLVFVDLSGPAAPKQPARSLPQFLDDVVTRLEAVPGIAGATAVNTPPFAGTGGWDLPHFTAEGQGFEQAERNTPLNLESVRPNYFATLQVPLLRGRVFSVDDRTGAPEVAIVSEDVAARAWPGEDPIGKRLKFGRPDSGESWRTVVGVVRPTRYRELFEPRPTLYLPAAQFIMSAPMLVLRTSLPPGLVPEIVRTRVHAADPNLDVTRVTTFADRLAGPLARPRFNAFLAVAFGVTALLLSTIGLYAVVAAGVRRRRTEIGIRVALGATRADVYRLVVGEGLRLAAIGAAIGLTMTVLVTRLMRGLLFEVRPLDPATLLGAVILLVGAAGLASWLPARRAVRVDPVAALRAE